ncbi:hypothetical protein D3C73_1053660 [compost metagenome]
MMGFTRRATVKRHVTPNHQADQLFYRGLGNLAAAGKAAILENGEPIAELEHFV